MTDDRPEPRYGQYAPVPPPPTPAPAASPPATPRPTPVPPPSLHTDSQRPLTRRTWDVVLTTALLLIGVYDVVTGFAVYGNLSVPVRDVFEQQGLGEFTSDELAIQFGTVLNVVRVALLAIAIVVSLIRINRHRLAFWVPLGAGILAALAAVVVGIVLVMSDPAFSAYVESLQ